MNILLSEIVSHADPSQVADIFLEKPQPLHDLLQKAAGWLLRDAGKKFPPEERFTLLKA